MSRAPMGLGRIGLLVSAACGSFAPPPVTSAVVWNYPEGFAVDFPHLTPGNRVAIATEVTTARGEPVEGPEIRWDDGYAVVEIQPQQLFADRSGIARAQWLMRPLPGSQYSRLVVVHGYLPGANNSPVEYRAIVIACSEGAESESVDGPGTVAGPSRQELTGTADPPP